jgi:hypothetical protein
LKLSSFFPPKPPSFRGRSAELCTLAAMIQTHHPAKIALVGSGGSGKSTLACALGHRLRRFFGGRIHWFRIGAWDVRTLGAMMALRFGVREGGADSLRFVRQFLAGGGPTLVVLDNHEDDVQTAALLDGLRETQVSWVITARRSLLGGVRVFPVVPPLVTVGKSPFPRVAAITRLLRWNPVALDLADALVLAGIESADDLGKWLQSRGIERVRPVEHEDDLPEVALLVERAWRAISAAARRMLGVLAHMGGDHMDAGSLVTLSGAGARGAETLARLSALRLVQEPIAGRFALHATVRHAVVKRTAFPAGRLCAHYLELLEREPARKDLEQTHLFAAMDYAQELGDLGTILRVQKVYESL